MSKKIYTVSRPAVVWFDCEVEAGSEDEALTVARHPSFKDWVPDYSGVRWDDGAWSVMLSEEWEEEFRNA